MKLTIIPLILIALLILPIGAEAASAGCPADVDADDSVGMTDLLAVIAGWGPCGDCAADLDANGDVGMVDLVRVLAQWGPCPVTEAKCDPEIPTFFDPSGSDAEWMASGVCGDALEGVDGPPACTEEQYLLVLEDINYILDTYEAAGAILEQVAGGGQTYMANPVRLLCTTTNQKPFPADTFDHVNACYNAYTRWLAFESIVIIEFNWGVNTENVVEAYQAAVDSASPGAVCELDQLMSGTGTTPMETGIHATFDSGWIGYQVIATEQCDYYGCRCLAEIDLWSDGDGTYTESQVENNSGCLDGTCCTDPRFDF